MTRIDTRKVTIPLRPSRTALSFDSTSGCSLWTSQRLLTDAASMVGTARKKENSAAALRVRPWLRPPIIVAPERLNPGRTMDRTWKQPIQKADLLETLRSLSIRGYLNHR